MAGNIGMKLAKFGSWAKLTLCCQILFLSTLICTCIESSIEAVTELLHSQY